MNKNDDYSCKKIKIFKKPKFTEKRNPYKKYQLAKWSWKDVFLEIENLKNVQPKFLKIVSEKYGINHKTLCNKYYNYEKNKKLDINQENRGGNNKIFTEHEEKEIFMFLKENFIDKNKVLCNDIIKLHSQEKFKLIHPNESFEASNGWCNMFKKRWNLSTVKISISKITPKIYTEEEINIFLNRCKDTLTKVGSNFFLI